ncbi:histidine triad (HIT) protein [Halanaerobium hydrogeniformans]|uniref:Histidine triad (HIT) protein n=2 Tax=Halanaerobium hydrogeniformans TaxID=656519 RepID=E4RP12_HALHG|nr:HIT family protein [Halanaerobium hydrogeniformans]ADQ13702.1 histidine triad (HIT) protein [Halanaerobium hydrogeniformans]
MGCIFCEYDKDKYIAENDLAFAIYDNFPVNKGHILVIPKRHFSSYFEAKAAEIEAIFKLTKRCKEILEVKYDPDGYNIGVNVNYPGGQTIMHLHQHIIPRYKGDVENPRGGIRKLKPNLVEYDG